MQPKVSYFNSGIEISRQNKEENRDELPGLHFDFKNKIVARNVHEEDDDHQQHDDVPHKDHSHEKHDHENDKREDCEEDWEHYSYNDEDREWGFRMKYIILEQLV